jgi:hypothetical protein
MPDARELHRIITASVHELLETARLEAQAGAMDAAQMERLIFRATGPIVHSVTGLTDAQRGELLPSIVRVILAAFLTSGMVAVPPGFVPTAFDIQASRIDGHFPRDVHNVGEYGTLLFERVIRTRESEPRPLQKAAIPLLLNGLTTVLAAVELWRRGLLLPVGILLRNALETIATVAVITHDKQAYERYQGGEYKSAEAFTDVKKAWPWIGGEIARISGFLSNEFVHVGETYRTWVAISKMLTEGDLRSLRRMMLPLKMTIYTFDLVTEVVCSAVIEKPRFLRPVSPGTYLLHPTQGVVGGIFRG